MAVRWPSSPTEPQSRILAPELDLGADALHEHCPGSAPEVTGKGLRIFTLIAVYLRPSFSTPT